MDSSKPLLSSVLPDLADELVAGLTSTGRQDLANQVPTLQIWDLCGCDDSFCTSFYVGPQPSGAWGEEGDHENEMPDVESGMVVLDVVAGIIRYVEVLDRPESKVPLQAAMRPLG